MAGDLTVERLQEIIAAAVNTAVEPLHAQITLLTMNNDTLVQNNHDIAEELREVRALSV